MDMWLKKKKKNGYEINPFTAKLTLKSHKTQIEARQSTSESTKWPRFKPHEHSSMKIKERIRVNKIKRKTCLIIGGQLPNSWANIGQVKAGYSFISSKNKICQFTESFDGNKKSNSTIQTKSVQVIYVKMNCVYEVKT